MTRHLCILGAGGQAKVVAFVARSQFPDIRLEFYAQENPHGLKPYAGSVESFLEQAQGKCFVVAIGRNQTRLKLAALARQAGARAKSLVHPAATVAPDAQIESGSVVMAGAVIHPHASIGQDCIVNTAAVVEHDCQVHQGVHLGPGSILAGAAVIRRGTWIGMGARVLEGREIAEDIVVGAGAVVLRNLSERGIYVGVPAQRLED